MTSSKYVFGLNTFRDQFNKVERNFLWAPVLANSCISLSAFLSERVNTLDCIETYSYICLRSPGVLTV